MKLHFYIPLQYRLDKNQSMKSKKSGNSLVALLSEMVLMKKIYIFVFLQNELFEKAKNEILDEVISLSQVTPQHW